MVFHTMTREAIRTHGGVAAILIASLFGVALLGGCLEEIEEKIADEQAPRAELVPSAFVAWDGETIHFNATGSEDPNGQIVEWRFDFGDGTELTITERQAANVSHAYGHGGEFTVTLTVLDDGENQTGIKTHTVTTTVAVNERNAVAAHVLYAAPANTTGDAGHFAASYDANEGIDRATTNLSVRSLLLAGTSEVAIRIIAPDNTTILDERVQVDAGENRTVEFVASATQQGDYELNVTARSGGAQIAGEFLLRYDDGYPHGSM